MKKLMKLVLFLMFSTFILGNVPFTGNNLILKSNGNDNIMTIDQIDVKTIFTNGMPEQKIIVNFTTKWSGLVVESSSDVTGEEVKKFLASTITADSINKALIPSAIEESTRKSFNTKEDTILIDYLDDDTYALLNRDDSSGNGMTVVDGNVDGNGSSNNWDLVFAIGTTHNDNVHDKLTYVTMVNQITNFFSKDYLENDDTFLIGYGGRHSNITDASGKNLYTLYDSLNNDNIITNNGHLLVANNWIKTGEVAKEIEKVVDSANENTAYGSGGTNGVWALYYAIKKIEEKNSSNKTALFMIDLHKMNEQALKIIDMKWQDFEEIGKTLYKIPSTLEDFNSLKNSLKFKTWNELTETGFDSNYLTSFKTYLNGKHNDPYINGTSTLDSSHIKLFWEWIENNPQLKTELQRVLHFNKYLTTERRLNIFLTWLDNKLTATKTTLVSCLPMGDINNSNGEAYKGQDILGHDYTNIFEAGTGGIHYYTIFKKYLTPENYTAYEPGKVWDNTSETNVHLREILTHFLGAYTLTQRWMLTFTSPLSNEFYKWKKLYFSIDSSKLNENIKSAVQNHPNILPDTPIGKVKVLLNQGRFNQTELDKDTRINKNNLITTENKDRYYIAEGQKLTINFINPSESEFKLIRNDDEKIRLNAKISDFSNTPFQLTKANIESGSYFEISKLDDSYKTRFSTNTNNIIDIHALYKNQVFTALSDEQVEELKKEFWNDNTPLTTPKEAKFKVRIIYKEGNTTNILTKEIIATMCFIAPKIDSLTMTNKTAKATLLSLKDGFSLNNIFEEHEITDYVLQNYDPTNKIYSLFAKNNDYIEIEARFTNGTQPKTLSLKDSKGNLVRNWDSNNIENPLVFHLNQYNFDSEKKLEYTLGSIKDDYGNKSTENINLTLNKGRSVKSEEITKLNNKILGTTEKTFTNIDYNLYFNKDTNFIAYLIPFKFDGSNTDLGKNNIFNKTSTTNGYLYTDIDDKNIMYTIVKTENLSNFMKSALSSAYDGEYIVDKALAINRAGEIADISIEYDIAADSITNFNSNPKEFDFSIKKYRVDTVPPRLIGVGKTDVVFQKVENTSNREVKSIGNPVSGDDWTGQFRKNEFIDIDIPIVGSVEDYYRNSIANKTYTILPGKTGDTYTFKFADVTFNDINGNWKKYISKRIDNDYTLATLDEAGNKFEIGNLNNYIKLNLPNKIQKSGYNNINDKAIIRDLYLDNSGNTATFIKVNKNNNSANLKLKDTSLGYFAQVNGSGNIVLNTSRTIHNSHNGKILIQVYTFDKAGYYRVDNTDIYADNTINYANNRIGGTIVGSVINNKVTAVIDFGDVSELSGLKTIEITKPSTVNHMEFDGDFDTYAAIAPIPTRNTVKTPGSNKRSITLTYNNNSAIPSTIKLNALLTDILGNQKVFVINIITNQASIIGKTQRDGGIKQLKSDFTIINGNQFDIQGQSYDR